MKKGSFMALILALLPLFLLCACKETTPPVTLLAFRPFHPDMNSRDIAFYIDWENTFESGTVDSLILSVSCVPDSEQTFLVQLQEPEGVEPQSHNGKKVITLKQQDLPAEEITALDVSIHQVNFTDGSTWEDDGAQTVLSAEIDGQKGSGTFPVKLNQAIFFESSANPRIQLDPLNFHVDWTNLFEANSVIGVVYQIRAKTVGQVTIPDERGSMVTYVSRFFEDPEQWVPPSADNSIYIESIPAFPAASAFRKGGAAIFEVTVCKAIDSNGIVWEAPAEDTPIKVGLNGKKGYSILEDQPNASVQGLIDRIQKETSKCGLELGQPAVSVKDGSYCVLRYDDLDVRVELSESNEVLTESLSFVLYAVLQYDDQDKFIQAFNDRLFLLIRCVSAAILTDLPYSEVVQKLDGYPFEDAETPFGKIEFDGQPYDIYEDVLSIKDEYSNIIICDLFGIGKNIYYPPNVLFWVRESPWPSQNVEVPH